MGLKRTDEFRADAVRIAWPASVTAVIGVHVQHFHAQAQASRARADLEEEPDHDLRAG